MRANQRLLLLVALLGVFVAGVVHLFQLRFATGDVYPPYSTLRADPLGCRALYESLDALPGFDAQRNFQSLAKLSPAPRTVFFLGCPAEDLTVITPDEARQLDALLRNGNRLVITLLPASTNPPPKVAKSTPVRQTRKQKAPPAPESTTNSVALKQRWDFHLNYSATATNALWHSTLYFDKLGPSWRVLATRGQFPAVIERNVGHGTVVLCADSYFVSNEALRRDRQPELLVQLLGTHSTLVFDEVHLGTVHNPGLMTLARKYRLHGLLAGLLVLAGLFIWQNAVSFVPAHPDRTDSAIAAGKDSAAGFVNLLRRSLPPTKVLGVCLDEWKKSFAHQYRRAPAKLEKIQATVTAHARDPLTGYHAVTAILKERK